jgi:hypothetical protein
MNETGKRVQKNVDENKEAKAENKEIKKWMIGSAARNERKNFGTI